MDTFSILMPLKDRVSYTRRIMNKWNSEGFPYEIIIADGGQDLYIQEELSDKSNFENLNYTYIKCGIFLAINYTYMILWSFPGDHLYIHKNVDFSWR